MSLFLLSFANLEIVSVPGKSFFLCDSGSRCIYNFTLDKSGQEGISELFSKICPLAPEKSDFCKLPNREISVLLLSRRRKEKIDVFSKSQFKLTQNQRYEHQVTVEDMDRLSRLQPELAHFIYLFYGFDQAEFTPQDIAELDQRLKSLPTRLQLSCKNRPNLAEVFLQLEKI